MSQAKLQKIHQEVKEKVLAKVRKQNKPQNIS